MTEIPKNQPTPESWSSDETPKPEDEPVTPETIVDYRQLTKEDIEKIDDPEQLRELLKQVLLRADELEQRIATIPTPTGAVEKAVTEKADRLHEIRFGLTETTERMTKPYIVSAGLQNANTALNILADKGQMNSIILEGEPGTGKTQWAYSEVGQELQDGNDAMLIHVRVKDSMRAQDLLYTVDNIRRLSDAQTTPIPEQIRVEAESWKGRILAGEVDPSTDEDYKRFSAKMHTIAELGESSKDLSHINYVDLGPVGEAIIQSALGKKVYLLIDEIEKGREELMTGMLDEIENLNFTIEETGSTIKGKKENMRIIITTNTEESDKIPASFRRRSLYHFIDYPTKDEMAEIVDLNYPDLDEELMTYALDVFYQLHNDENLQKKPSTPELLSWIHLLKAEFPNGQLPDSIPHKEILLKYSEDNEHLDHEEELQEYAEQVWDSLTTTEKQYYFIPEHDEYNDRNEFRYVNNYDEAVKRIATATGLDGQVVIESILRLRKDSARIDNWLNPPAEETAYPNEKYDAKYGHLQDEYDEKY